MIRAHMGQDGALFFHVSGPDAPEQTRALMAQLQQLLPGGGATRTARIGGQLVHLRVDAGPSRRGAAVVPPIDRAGERHAP